MNRKELIDSNTNPPFMDLKRRLTDAEAIAMIVRLMRRSTTRATHRQSAPEAN
jgi:hypothetical protein